jgi:hypothetical protein
MCLHWGRFTKSTLSFKAWYQLEIQCGKVPVSPVLILAYNWVTDFYFVSRKLQEKIEIDHWPEDQTLYEVTASLNF